MTDNNNEQVRTKGAVPSEQARTAHNTTVAELMETLAPPREGTTGAHVVSVPPSYLLVIQGPEARWLTARVLEMVEALQKQTQERPAQDAAEEAEVGG